MKLNQKVIFVTGGAGILGKVFCEMIAEAGGIPLIGEKDRARANEVESLLKQRGLRSHAVTVDITDRKSLETALLDAEKLAGPIDALVNNAYPKNSNFNRDFFDVDYSDFCENTSMHLGGYFLASQIFAKYFLKRKVGNIVNIASIYGVAAPRFEIYEGTDLKNGPEYAAIKAGVVHLSRFMASRFKGTGIRVNCISPGGILHSQPEKFLAAYRSKSSMKGMLSPEDIAGTLIYLLSDSSKYVLGQNIVVDDGFTLG